MNRNTAIAILVTLLLGLVAGYCYGTRRPEAPGINQRAKSFVEDSLKTWKEKDRLDSVAIDSLIQLANREREKAQAEKRYGMMVRRDRDNLRALTNAKQDELDTLVQNRPPEADADHPGVEFWRNVAWRQREIAQKFRLEADLARQGDAGFLGTIASLEAATAYDQRTIARLRESLGRVTAERNKVVAVLDTLRRYKDCAGPLGVPCPEVGLGLGITAGPTQIAPLKVETTVGATLGVYFPLKRIRI